MTTLLPPDWLGKADLSPIASENRCDTALAYLRSMNGLGLTPDDRIRILAHMMAIECARAPAIHQAQDAAAYAAHLLGVATAGAWHGRVNALLGTPQGRA